MIGEKPMMRVLPLLRQFRLLERKRSDEGVTPSEYERWNELKLLLSKHVPQSITPSGGERRKHVRIPSRILVEFSSPGHLKSAVIRNVSRGGLFINTPFAPEIGTKLVLVLSVGAQGEKLEIPCEVVSNNVGDGFSTNNLGMGVRFGVLSDPQRGAVESLFCEALGDEMVFGPGRD
jgi:Tfp pilus assembly protein PilZ